MGLDDEDVKAKRTALRAKIKANLASAMAAGVDVEGKLFLDSCWFKGLQRNALATQDFVTYSSR
jgi:hypothetical protein